jgi:hypothetical protein
MTKTMHLRWLRLKRQTRLSGPRAAQRRTAAWATLPIFNDVDSTSNLAPAPARTVLQ